MNCRFCEKTCGETILDLGFSPFSNAYLRQDQLSAIEAYYPLRLRVCEHCWLIQTEDYANASELFTEDYAYYSSASKSWLAHASAFSKMAIARFALDHTSFVMEVAANDGYLLKNFLDEGIPCVGIEPALEVSQKAVTQGIPIINAFFGTALAKKMVTEQGKADLLIGNNVYAHVPDIRDFTEGLKVALSQNGTISLEFPHALNLFRSHQFDTVYHEHFSYLTLNTVIRIFAEAGLNVFDVEQIPTHGGSLRIFGAHELNTRLQTQAVADILDAEHRAGLCDIKAMATLQSTAARIKLDLLSFLLDYKKRGKKIVAYGAAAKGNTLLNYAGIDTDLISCVFDAAESKQGKFLPGSHIPIRAPSELRDECPDAILILPWNIADEIVSDITKLCVPGTKFFTATPNLREVF